MDVISPYLSLFQHVRTRVLLTCGCYLSLSILVSARQHQSSADMWMLSLLVSARQHQSSADMWMPLGLAAGVAVIVVLIVIILVVWRTRRLVYHPSERILLATVTCKRQSILAKSKFCHLKPSCNVIILAVHLFSDCMKCRLFICGRIDKSGSVKHRKNVTLIILKKRASLHVTRHGT